MAEQLYFAYGSNMDLKQMDFRCPDAQVVENVRLMDYRLTFCGGRRRNGVATIFPEKGSYVDGVLWKITEKCENSLDMYEGYPMLYGKKVVTVKNPAGEEMQAVVYVMDAPYKDVPAAPAQVYLNGILRGCEQNGIPKEPILKAARELPMEQKMPSRKREEAER